MKRVIIVGSPRTHGRSAHLAEMLFEANIDERPEDELFLVPVSEIEVGPCVGCNACRQKSQVIVRGDDGDEVEVSCHRCIYDDDMQTVYDLLDDADALTIVCPVYFSGAPAPMKCLLDRLQPYFWAYRENGPRLPKRPLDLHIVGEGGDPHGYGPLVSEVNGPCLLAGFGIERIFDWVGKIAPDGEIMQEAMLVTVPLPLPSGIPEDGIVPGEEAGEGESRAGDDAFAEGGLAVFDGKSARRADAERENGLGDVSSEDAGHVNAAQASAPPSAPSSPGRGKPRPKLDLSHGGSLRDDRAKAETAGKSAKTNETNKANKAGKTVQAGKGSKVGQAGKAARGGNARKTAGAKPEGESMKPGQKGGARPGSQKDGARLGQGGDIRLAQRGGTKLGQGSSARPAQKGGAKPGGHNAKRGKTGTSSRAGRNPRSGKGGRRG